MERNKVPHAATIDHPDMETTRHSGVTLQIHPRVLFCALLTAVALTIAIAAASFWLSFGALRDLAVMAGTDTARAWVIPIVLDGAIISTTVTAIALSHHTDARTVRGRRFVLAVLALAAGASIAGNAYHATLNTTVLPAVIAGGIATIAPVFLLAMTEVLATILRAPRGRSGAASLFENTQNATETPSSNQLSSRRSHEAGGLHSVVWSTVLVYLQHPDWSYSDVARELDVSPSTVSQRLADWFELQKATAEEYGLDLSNSTVASGLTVHAGLSVSRPEPDGEHTRMIQTDGVQLAAANA